MYWLIDYVFCVSQFGDSQKLRLVRILRSTVMVRVGGGWVALDEFLVKNDPCRGKYSSVSPMLIFEALMYILINVSECSFTLVLFVL